MVQAYLLEWMVFPHCKYLHWSSSKTTTPYVYVFYTFIGTLVHQNKRPSKGSHRTSSNTRSDVIQSTGSDLINITGSTGSANNQYNVSTGSKGLLVLSAGEVKKTQGASCHKFSHIVIVVNLFLWSVMKSWYWCRKVGCSFISELYNIVACHLPRGSKLRWSEDMGGG